MTKRVGSAVLPALKEALLKAFWYKNDLRPFLESCISHRDVVARQDWNAYKVAIISSIVDELASDQHKYFDDLLNLLIETSDLGDPIRLKKHEDGAKKYEEAVAALAALRPQVAPYKQLRSEADATAQRREAERKRNDAQQAFSAELEDLNRRFSAMHAEPPQQRGYALERLLKDLFELFDLDTKGSFRIVGEQIDCAFTHDSTEYVMEAKWQRELASSSDLHGFSGKIGSKLDNTLGLFVSMSGFQPTAIAAYSHRRSVMILMTGADLAAVLEGRFDLGELLTRKRQHAARTGEVLADVALLMG
ncbi:hypothetical protein [Gordonia terrae]